MFLERHATRTDCAVKVLAALTRIDHDLMSASFKVVYPRLLVVSIAISDHVRTSFMKMFCPDPNLDLVCLAVLAVTFGVQLQDQGLALGYYTRF